MKKFNDFARMTHWVKSIVDLDVTPGELAEVFYELDEWYNENENDTNRELKPFLTDRIKQLRKDPEQREMAEMCIEGLNKDNEPVRWYWQMLAK